MTEQEYNNIIKQCSTDSGPMEAYLSALDVHTKRGIVRYQSEKGMPVLAACVTGDLTKHLKSIGYRKGYTNRSRTAKYYIKSDNDLHKRMMIKDVPIRKKHADSTPGQAMKTCGLQLISIVDQSGLSQNEFAKQTGIPQSALSDLKNLKSSLTVNTLDRYFMQAGYRITGFTYESMPQIESVKETKQKR